MQNQTKQQLLALSKLIIELKNTEDDGNIRRITTEIAVITAYIKRRNNLFFLSEENELLAPDELVYCLKESLDNLALSGAECGWSVQLKERLPFAAVMAFYDAFEMVAELVMDALEEIFVSVSMRNDIPALSLSIVCRADLTPLLGFGFLVMREDENEWTVEYVYTEDGEIR